jgi:hypothetical protein
MGKTKLQRRARSQLQPRTLFEEMPTMISFLASGSGRWSTAGRGETAGAHRIWSRRSSARLQNTSKMPTPRKANPRLIYTDPRAVLLSPRRPATPPGSEEEPAGLSLATLNWGGGNKTRERPNGSQPRICDVSISFLSLLYESIQINYSMYTCKTCHV